MPTLTTRSRATKSRSTHAAGERARTTGRRHASARAPLPSSRSPAIDAYIERAAPFAQPILKRLREIVRRACPSVAETIKWGMPSFEYKGPLASMAAFKQHATFGFLKHSLLNDPTGALQQRDRTAMGNFGCLRTLADLPSDATLARLVKAAAKLNDDGVKVPRSTRAKKPVPVPADFAKALRAVPKARATFDAFPPSHRREYLEWITEAKRPETRAKRMATAILWLSQGKGRNWKYERRA